MIDYLLPIVLFCVPVLLVIALTVGRGKQLSGSCGGVGADGRMQSLIEFTMAVLDSHGFITDEQLQSFRDAGFDDAAIIEVIGQIAVMTFTILYNHVNETEVDFPVPAEV